MDSLLVMSIIKNTDVVINKRISYNLLFRIIDAGHNTAVKINKNIYLFYN
jgi:hypothetical protein